MSSKEMIIIGIFFIILSFVSIVISNDAIWAGCIASASIWSAAASLKKD